MKIPSTLKASSRDLLFLNSSLIETSCSLSLLLIETTNEQLCPSRSNSPPIIQSASLRLLLTSQLLLLFQLQDNSGFGKEKEKSKLRKNLTLTNIWNIFRKLQLDWNVQRGLVESAALLKHCSFSHKMEFFGINLLILCTLKSSRFHLEFLILLLVLSIL